MKKENIELIRNAANLAGWYKATADENFRDAYAAITDELYKKPTPKKPTTKKKGK